MMATFEKVSDLIQELNHTRDEMALFSSLGDKHWDVGLKGFAIEQWKYLGQSYARALNTLDELEKL